MKAVLEDIAEERMRQIGAEGWSSEHDDLHGGGELANAAACYAVGHQITEVRGYQRVTFGSPLWPWDASWWKPGTRRRNLIKAAALIVAEIERLDRAAAGGAA